MIDCIFSMLIPKRLMNNDSHWPVINKLHRYEYGDSARSSEVKLCAEATGVRNQNGKRKIDKDLLQ